MNNQAICEREHCNWYRGLCSWSAYTYNCAGLLSTTTWVMKVHTLCERWKLLVKILSYQYNTHPRYPNSLLGNHRSSVKNSSSSYDCNLTFTSSATSWTGQAFDATEAKSIDDKGWLNNSLSSQRSWVECCRSVGNADVTTSPSTSKPKPIGAIVGGVVGGVVLLLSAIILGIYLVRRNSRRKSVTDPSPLLMNETHIRSNSDTTNGYTGYTSLSSSPMQRLSSPTIRTHLTRASTSIHSFPFFSSGGSSVSHPMRQQSPPPVAIQRDETAVEPFRLAPTNNYNPDRKQADGTYPVYDPPTAPPTVRMEVQSTPQTPRGRTKYNPPAYTEPSNSSLDVGGSSSSPSPATVSKSHGKMGSSDTQQSFTSIGNPTIGNVINPLAPLRTVNSQINSHAASANTSLNVLTGHGHQLSGDTTSDSDRRRRQDTEDNFSVGDIA